MPVEFELDPWGHLFPVALRNSGSALRVVDLRAYNLQASDLLENAALDRYINSGAKMYHRNALNFA
jgi:phospholipid-binding lipoprotein MlaA